MVKEKETSDRDGLWTKYVEAYKVANPVKGAAKEKNGEFKTPPATFLGKVKSVKGKEIIY